MKHLILLFSFLFLGLTAYSQKTYIHGTVKDKSSLEVLPYCSVMMMQADTISNFAITDHKGYFEIPANPGSYEVVFRFVGYHTDTISLTLKNEAYFMGNVFLRVDATVLDEVVVKESARTTLVDKDETIVTEEMRVGTATTSDVLDKVNGVTFDRYNDEIKVDNEKNVLLLVNGLKKDQTYIKNLSPDRIAKIEVIRDPSGRYGLEGYSSVINVQLKKNYVGQEFFIDNMNIFDLDSPEKDYFMVMNNLHGTYNYTRKALNIYAQYWGGNTRFSMFHDITKDYGDSLTIIQTSRNGNRNFQINTIYSYLTIGADYQLSKVHTLSFEGHLGGQPYSKTKGIYAYQTWMGESLIDEIEYQNNTSNNSTNYSGTAFYIGNISDDKALNIDYTIGGSNSANSTEFEYKDTNPILSSTKGVENYSKLNLEWTQTLTDKFSYQLGYGNTWNRKQGVNTSTSENDFKLTDLRNRAFLYGTWKILKPLTLKAGMATENSLPQLNDQKQSYWIHKPHFDLQYKPLQWLSFKLKYRSKADYPSLSEANPEEIFLDANTVQKGNPYLKPSTIHKASFKVTAMGGFASASVYYHFSDDYIAPVGKLRADGIFEYSYDNLGGYVDKGIKFNFGVPFGKSIFWRNSAKIYHSSMTYQNYENEFTDWRGESQLMYIDKESGVWAGLMLQKSNTKIITPQGYRQGNNDFWGIMAQKPFFDKKLSVMMMYMLPINWITDYSQDTHIETPFYTQHSTIDLNMIKNVFLLKVNYRFHRGKEIEKIEKNIEREEQKTGGLF